MTIYDRGVARVDPRLRAALVEQSEHRRRALARGARHVGWKLGVGDRESIGGEIAIGYLTAETVLPDGAAYRPDARADLHADAEAMVEFACDVGVAEGATAVGHAIARFGAALEIVDLTRLAGEPEAVVAANVFHRAVAFAELDGPPSGDVRILVDREVRGAAPWPRDVLDRIVAAARVLDAIDERFRAGDRVITGSIVQAPLRPGEEVVADFGGLAQIRLCVEEG